jgi:hypothetical protein
MKKVRAGAGALRLAAAVAMVVLPAAGAALAAAKGAGKEPASAAYTISNIAAVVMCLAALAVPCKRYHRM